MSFLDKMKSLFAGDANGASSGNARPDMISCEAALSVVHDFLDGELDGSMGDSVREHFEVCQACYPHLRMEEAFRTALHRASTGETAPSELRSKVLDLLRQAGNKS